MFLDMGIEAMEQSPGPSGSVLGQMLGAARESLRLVGTYAMVELDSGEAA